MPLSASNLYMNWTGVTFTYGATPTVISIGEVKNVSVERGGDVKRWSADAALYCKALVTRDRTRRVTIKGGDVARLAQVPQDTPGTLVCVLNDLHNGTSTGALTLTVTNASLTVNPNQGEHNEYATGDATFEAFAPDGITDPMTIAQAV